MTLIYEKFYPKFSLRKNLFKILPRKILRKILYKKVLRLEKVNHLFWPKSLNLNRIKMKIIGQTARAEVKDNLISRTMKS